MTASRRQILFTGALASLALAGAACARSGQAGPPPPPTPQYAIYAEYAKDSNKLMKNGLNQRIFNKVEAQSGTDIALNPDASISLAPGTYHITGFSMTTTSASMGVPVAKHNNVYPGYCILYPKAFSADSEALKHAISICSAQTALYLAPGLLDTFYTVTEKTDIMLGHQSGNELNNEVYLSVYDVDGAKSDFHVFARIGITKM